MKKTIFILAIFVIVNAESSGQRQAGNDDFITVDLTKKYSTKKELVLQDFMDVEYIKLETNDDFLNQGFVMDVGKNIILVKNLIDDGDIFVYDRSGKALRKINHKGQFVSKEYTQITSITLDEDNNEIFVSDHYTQIILVYDLNGKFKRSFKHKKNSGDPFKPIFYTEIYNYDKNNLICYDQRNETSSRSFVLISKKDGNITREFKIPFKENISLTVRSKPVIIVESATKSTAQSFSATPGRNRSIILFKGNWMLLDLSSDTVYTLLPDYNLHPLFVRTPAIHSMSPKVFLLLSFISDRYYFMDAMKFEYDMKTRTGFPSTPFLYDKQEREFFSYTVYNGDYSTKKEVKMSALRPVNHEIESLQCLEAYQLVDDYKAGILKGKLKEIAATLDEEDNPVIMLVKHRK